MYNGHTVAVVVPAHDEELLVGRTIATLPDYVDQVIVVDDGSTDCTAERAGVAAIGRAGFCLVVHPGNRGVGAAIASGYRRALQLDVDVVVVVGADAQMDPADMSALVDAVAGGADYAKGNRLGFPGLRRVMPPVRLLGNIVLTSLTRLTSGYWHLSDSQCGYTAIHSRALRTLDLSGMYPRYGYPNDLLAHLNASGLTVVDVPVRPVYGTERSGIRVLRVLFPILGVLAWSGLRRLWCKYTLSRPLLRRRARQAA